MMVCCTKQNLLARLKANALPLLSLASILLGVALGCGLRFVGDIGYDAESWIGILGELFMRMLKCLILPLVATCLITGITSLGGRASKGRVASVTFLYIMLGNVVGAVIGVIVSAAIRPGSGMNNQGGDADDKGSYISYTDLFLDLLRNIVPDNLIKMTTHSVYTHYNITWSLAANQSADNVTHAHYEISSIVRSVRDRDGINTIGIVTVSIALGMALNAAGKQGEPLLNVIRAFYAAVEKILFAMFWFAPLGIFSLIAVAIIRVDSLQQVIISLGMYVLTFLVCFVVHICVYMPALYFVICRRNPLGYYAHMADAILAGFAPPSSAAALPFLLEDAKHKLGIRPELAHFILPLCTTLNRDGSAMFVTCTALFVAQAHGIVLSAATYFIIVVLTSVLSFTIAMIPSSSIVLALIVCNAVNIPMQEMVAIIMLTEFILDRLRTTNNVVSHGFACGIIQHFCPQSSDDTCADEARGDETDKEGNVNALDENMCREEALKNREKLCVNPKHNVPNIDV